MAELVTEARVESYVLGGWSRPHFSRIGERAEERPRYPDMPEQMTIPEAIVEGRAHRRYELEGEVFPDAPRACPVRVIDSAGVVVEQWGRP
jgi:hypothetical protein